MNDSEKKQSLALAEHYFRSNNYQFAEHILKTVIKIDPNNSKANELLAYIYGNNGDSDTSHQLLERSCSKEDCSPEALYYLGSSQLKLNLYEKAVQSLKKSIEKAGSFFEAIHNLGMAYSLMGEIEKALSCYQDCLKYRKKMHELHFNIGRCFDELGSFEEALAHYSQAIEIKTDFALAWYNKAVTLHHLKRYDEAVIHYSNSIRLDPCHAEAWSNKAVALHHLKNYNEALFHYDKAIRLKPNFAEALSNKGNTLNDLKRHNEALSHHDEAIKLKPDLAEAWLNKGNTLNDLKRYSEALFHYEKASLLNPKLDFVYGDIVHLKMKLCDWLNVEESINLCANGIKASKKIISPFPLLALIDDPYLQKKCAEIYSKEFFPTQPKQINFANKNKKERIRIGYFSADFRDHPVSTLTVELFELHNKEKFEIFAFSYGADDKSKIRNRLKVAFDKFIDVSDKSDVDIVSLAKDIDIDIAVDLGGYTYQNRLSIFSHRIAPLQISYIGYPGTLSTNFIDYLIADNHVIPREFEEFYSEKIIKLPTYQANDRKREVSDKKFTKNELGIPNNYFVFCCFNNNYKFTPIIFDSWMRILKNVDNSVLFLYAENDIAQSNLKKEANARGIDSNRLIFSKQIPKNEYMSRYATCDLFLDTFPYNAGTTAADALWMDVPIITYPGKSFASRMASSLLSSLELNILIADSILDYEKKAIYLAKNSSSLSSIKQKLLKNKSSHSLFKTEIFTKNLEKAYETVYYNHMNDCLKSKY